MGIASVPLLEVGHTPKIMEFSKLKIVLGMAIFMVVLAMIHADPEPRYGYRSRYAHSRGGYGGTSRYYGRHRGGYGGKYQPRVYNKKTLVLHPKPAPKPSPPPPPARAAVPAPVAPKAAVPAVPAVAEPQIVLEETIPMDSSLFAQQQPSIVPQEAVPMVLEVIDVPAPQAEIPGESQVPFFVPNSLPSFPAVPDLPFGVPVA